MDESIFLARCPSRYLGGEINSVRKDLSQVDLRVCLAFPDVYEVGMSHLGLQVLYSLLNASPAIAAERVYAPGLDREAVMRERGIRLASLESGHPVVNFDLVGFSLQYELSYTNVLAMLDLAGIPLFALQRGEEHPLVIAGGPCAFNPEPLADFFDALLIGDGEEALPEMCECIIRAKRERMAKKEILNLLSQIEGVYIPGFFEPAYGEDGALKEIIPLKPGYERVIKRWVRSLDKTPLIVSPLVPYKKIVHDRLSLEIARGCTRGCRFCQAGMIYRPVRERGMDTIEKMVELSLASTGFDELSLASLSTGDYSCITELLTRLMDRYASQKVAISFPSLRSETLTPRLMEEIKKVRKTGFTIAPEAGTERLRRVINKGSSEEEILSTVSNVFEAGWNGIKLYFMMGLPTERQGDLEGIVALAARIRALAYRGGKRRSVAVSVSTFVPKAHTPFQWEGQIGIEEMRQRQDFLKREIRKLKLDFKWQDVYMSYLEGIFARGDRRLARVIEKAYRLGCRFDSWSEHLDHHKWEKALQGIDGHFYGARKRPHDEIFPWDHIDCGISRDYLWGEYEKALQSVFTPDCRTGKCNGCGICAERPDVQPFRVRVERRGEKGGVAEMDLTVAATLPGEQPAQDHEHRRLRMRFAKLGDGRFLSHLELLTLFSRAIKRAGIPIRFSEGFHPLPRVVFGPALPVGIESECEYLDMEIMGSTDPSALEGRLNRTLPDWIRIREVFEIPLKCRAVSDSIEAVTYAVSLQSIADKLFNNNRCLKEKIHCFYQETSRPVSLSTKRGVARIDLKQWVEVLAVKDAAALEMVIRMSGSKTVRPIEILKSVIGLSDEEAHVVSVKKTGVRFRKALP